MHHRLLVLSILMTTAVGCRPPTATAPPGNYDLTSNTISHRPATVRVGDPVVFTYTVDNQGSDDVPSRTWDVEFYVDGELVSFDRATSTVLSGRPTTYSKAAGYYHFKSQQPGRVPYRLVIDPSNRLKEVDESNNVVTGFINVQPAVP